MGPIFHITNGLPVILARFVIAATVFVTFVVPDVMAAPQLRCLNAGTEVIEGQAGVISTTCYSNISASKGGISVAPDKFFITSLEVLGDKDDKINESAEQLRATFTFPDSSHPGFVEPPATLVDLADTKFLLSLAFSTSPAHFDEMPDTGTTIITGFVTWSQVGGGVASGASDPFSLTVVVRDVPEPDTASLMLSGAVSLSLINIYLRLMRRVRRNSGSTIPPG